MTERWVLNASPLIVLARIGQERLLYALADEVVIPRAVAEEIEAGPTNDPAATETLRSLLHTGFRLDANTVREALSRTVGEKWEQHPDP